MKKALIITLLSIPSFTYADWADDWFDNSVIVDQPSAFANQQRNFYSAGSVRIRNQQSNDYLFSASLPRLSAGCGGVDLFMGGFSFLDADYLVEKYQNMIQAAPAVAFNMALSAMSDQLSTQIKQLESATNWLNQLQLDDCAMTKTVLTEATKDDPDYIGAVWNEITNEQSISGGVSDGYHASNMETQSNDNRPNIDLNERISECPIEYRAVIAPGSMIENVTDEFGMSAYSSFIRGLIGDIYISTSPGLEVPLVEEVPSCPDNDSTSLNDVLYGSFMQRNSRDAGGQCVSGVTDSIYDQVSDRLTSIATNLAAGGLTPANTAFINQNSYIPIYNILKTATINNQVAFEISNLSTLVGSYHSYYAMNELYRNVRSVITSAVAAATPAGVDAADPDLNRCDTKLYEHAVTKLERMLHRLNDYRSDFYISYQVVQADVLGNMQYTSLKKQEYENTMRRVIKGN
jgi:conjugative transfer pilus assembly protein TraH